MSFDPVALPWLAPAPDDFRGLCRRLSGGDADLGLALHKLAGYRLDSGQSASLSKAIARLTGEGADLSPLTPLRLGVLSNTTFDFIGDGLAAAAARHGVALQLDVAPLDQIEQEVFNPESDLCRWRPDAVLLAIDHRWFGLDRPALDGDDAARVDEALSRAAGVAQAIADNAGATAIVPTLAVPPSPLFGSYDRRLNGSARAMIDRFNRALLEVCTQTRSILFDVAALAEQVGTARWFDAVFYNLYKLPFAAEAVPLYADHLGRLLGAMRGKARKCLVLDLDNTCWGGVIGDDGLDGIRLGAGSAEGESFLAVQQTALALKSRGVILAVSSKNNDDVARGPFRSHPDMLLKEGDIAVFQANWQDKPSNLEAIARTLDIGLDALVFLDDNAAERAQVRSALPMVAAPELPADPALYPALLLAAGYFEAVSFSEEDKSRGDTYAANAQRAEVLSKSRNLGDYLTALEMRISHARFDSINRARIAQLINKSNQFNLTTRRYTEGQVAEMETGAAAFTLQTRLTDKFSDFGMIGVVIARDARHDGRPAWDIDTWLMSCRVLGRRVEDAMLMELASAARAGGVSALLAHYIPTAKNGMVSEHFDKLGFVRVAEQSDGSRDYLLRLDAYVSPELPFDGQAPA